MKVSSARTTNYPKIVRSSNSANSQKRAEKSLEIARANLAQIEGFIEQAGQLRVVPQVIEQKRREINGWKQEIAELEDCLSKFN